MWSSTKLHLRTTPRQFEREHHPEVLNADIKRQPTPADQLDRVDEIGLETKGNVAFNLDQAPNSAQ
jgi:hypothetical protein